MMIFAGLFFAAILFLFGWMHFFELRRYEINRHSVKLRKPLPDRLRILHLSDTHFAKRDKRLSAFFDRLAEEPCDLLVITGDIIDCPEGIPWCIENLSKFRPSLGAFAVLGNHDYYNYSFWDIIVHNFPGQSKPSRTQDVGALVTALEGAGIRVLRNETETVHVKEARILIHGLDDATTGKASLRRTMQYFDEKKINMLLTHTIDVFNEIGEDEIDLSFSGHSHGGQICLPWIGPLITHTMMGRRYASGIIRHKGAVCCVSRGVGHSRYLPVRLLCRPEAIVVDVTGPAPG